MRGGAGMQPYSGQAVSPHSFLVGKGERKAAPGIQSLQGSLGQREATPAVGLVEVVAQQKLS